MQNNSIEVNSKDELLLGNNLEDLQLLDPCVERADSVPEAEEAMLLAFVHAVQKLGLHSKHGIDEPPIRDLVKLRGYKVVFPDNLCPDSFLPGHGLLELEPVLLTFVASPFQAEMVGEYRPQLLPLEEIPVAAIEGLVLGERIHGGPDLVLGDKVGVGGVAEALPSDPRAGPPERRALLPADGGVDAEAADEVHGAARGVSEDGGGAVHGPADGAVSAGDLVEEDVLHVVVEVGAVEARHVLGEGRVRGGDLADGLEGADVVLAAGLEADVDERGAVRDDDGEDVTEHGGVGLPVLRLGGAVGPGDEEDVGDVGEGLESLRDGGGVGEVEVEVGDGRGGRRGPGRERAARDGVDLPRPGGGVGEREDVEEGGADDAGGSDDEGDALVGGLGGGRLLVLALLDRADRARPPPTHRGWGSIWRRGREEGGKLGSGFGREEARSRAGEGRGSGGDPCPCLAAWAGVGSWVNNWVSACCLPGSLLSW
jgi:predicted RNA-binding protein